MMIALVGLALIVEASIMIRYVLVRSMDRRSRARVQSAETSARQLYFLLPALREQNTVPSTLAAFIELCGTRPGVKAVVITTEREEHERLQHAFTVSTADVVLAYKREHDAGNKIVHLHYPRVDGNKSHQLNYAIDWLIENGAGSDDFVAVYDFDAKPSGDTVDEFHRTVCVHDYDALQQVPIPVKRIEQRIRERCHAAVAESLLHLQQRSLPIEKWRLWFNDRTPWRILPHYLCGSGLFLRIGAFTKHGPFPVVDDVPFGYRLYLYGTRIGVLSSYNQVDAHFSIRAVVNSNVFVFNGVIRFFDEIARCAKRGLGAATATRSVLLLLFGLSEVFEFMIYPYFLLLSLCLGLATADMPLVTLTLIALLMPSIGVLATRGILRIETGYVIPTGDLFAVCLVAPFRKFWRSFGPLIYCIKKTKSLLGSKSIVYAKTER